LIGRDALFDTADRLDRSPRRPPSVAPNANLQEDLTVLTVQSYKKAVPVETLREEIASHVDAYRPVP
jgi:hypothetical protein